MVAAVAANPSTSATVIGVQLLDEPPLFRLTPVLYKKKDRYDSIISASCATGISVAEVADCVQRDYGDFRYFKGVNKPSQSKLVLQIHPSEDRVICAFRSIREAGRVLKINSKSISRVLSGQQKTAGTYRFEYDDPVKPRTPVIRHSTFPPEWS